MNTRIFKSLRTAATLLACFLIVGSAFPQSRSSAADDGSKDPLLVALKIELARSKEKLKLENEKRPYFIEYTVTASQSYNAEAVFGAMRREGESRVRFLRAVVRVGDYKLDSNQGRGDGASELIPLDDDPIAIRQQVWLATDAAYKQAIESLTAKQARLKQIEIEYPVDDFAPASPVTSIGPLLTLDIGGETARKHWREVLINASNVFRTDDKIQSFSTSLNFSVLNYYLINTEGTTLRKSRESYSLSLSGSSQAPDGMRIDRGRAYSAAKLSELMSAEKFKAEAEKTIASLAALRAAPIVEDHYQGPVLFSPDAAADVFHDLVGNNVLGSRPPLGSPARTTTEYTNYFHSRVLPEFITVVDDPSISTFSGTTLFGHYDVDDEGVPAQTVTVVDKGKLQSYLVGRIPIRDFPASNGHGRNGAGSTQPAMSTLVVKSSETVSPADLEKKLLDMCKDRGLPFGYYVETLGGLTNPRLLYKVYVKDGHRELVRGARFGDLDRRTLRSDLAAVGNDATLDNRGGGIAMSMIVPSILIDEMEVRRDNTTKEKLPQYGPPSLVDAVPAKTGN